MRLAARAAGRPTRSGATSVTVNSFHHQAIKDLAPGLVASGWTDDGLIEAAESPDRLPLDAGGAVASGGNARGPAMAPEHGLFAALVNEASLARRGLVGGRRKEDPVAHAVERTP